MRPTALLLAGGALCAVCLALAATARADGIELSSLDALKQACQRSAHDTEHELFSVTFPASSWAFGAYDEDHSFLPIDTRRNLSTFGGSAQIFPSGLEVVGFVTQHPDELAQAKAAGAALHLGFFLGFDNPRRSPCLIRPAAAVTTVRADIAYVELLDGNGHVLAREDTTRLDSWQQEQNLSAVPGAGPRGALETPSTAVGAMPPGWADAFAHAATSTLPPAFAVCHSAGVARSAEHQGEVVVRLVVDPHTGTARSAEVEISSIGDEQDAMCVAQAVRGVRLPVDSSLHGDVRLMVPVRLAAD